MISNLKLNRDEMIVKCLYNKASEAFKNKKLPFGIFKESEFNLVRVGQEYSVIGILLCEKEITYLVDDGKIVVNYPSELFSVIDNTLSSKWFFKKFTVGDEEYPYREAIWGYYELCNDKNHFEQLMELENSALKIYFSNKKKMITSM